MFQLYHLEVSKQKDFGEDATKVEMTNWKAITTITTMPGFYMSGTVLSIDNLTATLYEKNKTKQKSQYFHPILPIIKLRPMDFK